MSSVSPVLTSDRADIYRISLDIPAAGYRDFITPWLIRESGFSLAMGTGLYRDILIDPGPACGIPSLLEHLDELNVRKLDYVLLTHVHIDHAGGLAELASAYPGLRVVVHERGREHLLDPSRLWKGSLQTLGGIAELFGPIHPLSERNLMPLGRDPEGLGIIDTPGHAAHHQCYTFWCGEKNVLFSGEAAGAYLGGKYIRPATPPRFFYDVSMASIARLREADADVICSGHYGYSADVSWVLDAAAEQLSLWRAVIGGIIESSPSGDLVEACFERLLSVDPHLAEYRELDEDLRQREAFYLKSSIKGFLG